jgi:hypothetical protein
MVLTPRQRRRAEPEMRIIQAIAIQFGHQRRFVREHRDACARQSVRLGQPIR